MNLQYSSIQWCRIVVAALSVRGEPPPAARQLNSTDVGGDDNMGGVGDERRIK